MEMNPAIANLDQGFSFGSFINSVLFSAFFSFVHAAIMTMNEDYDGCCSCLKCVKPYKPIPQLPTYDYYKSSQFVEPMPVATFNLITNIYCFLIDPKSHENGPVQKLLTLVPRPRAQLMTTLEETSLPSEHENQLPLPLQNVLKKLPTPGFTLAALMAAIFAGSFMYLVYEVMVGDAEWYEALTLLLTTALLVAYFSSVLLFPCLTVGTKKYRFPTLIFLAPLLSAAGFTLYTVPGNIRDVDSVWPEAIRILWYGLVGLAPIGGAYTLADDYEGAGWWLLHLKPHFKKEAK